MRFRRALIGALAALAIAGTAAAQVARPESVGDTLALVAQALGSTGAFERVEIDEAGEAVTLRARGGAEFVSHPEDLHRMLQEAADDAERERILVAFAVMLAEQAQEAAALAPVKDTTRIVPVLRQTGFTAGLTETLPLSDPFAGDLSVFYVFDHPTAITYVTEADLAEFNLAREAIPKIADQNVGVMGWQPELRGNGIWFIVFDGTYETTFLLNEGMWNAIDETLGTVIMLALARDAVMFSDADFPGAEAEMRRVAAENFAGLQQPLSPLIYEWTAEGWAVRPE